MASVNQATTSRNPLVASYRFKQTTIRGQQTTDRQTTIRDQQTTDRQTTTHDTSSDDDHYDNCTNDKVNIRRYVVLIKRLIVTKNKNYKLFNAMMHRNNGTLNNGNNFTLIDTCYNVPTNVSDGQIYTLERQIDILDQITRRINTLSDMSELEIDELIDEMNTPMPPLLFRQSSTTVRFYEEC